MLDGCVLAAALLGGWLVSGVVGFVLRKLRGDMLPAGAIEVERDPEEVAVEVTSPKWAQFGVLFSMGGTILVSIIIVLLVILGLWDSVAGYVAFDFPEWMNWYGILGIWFHLVWGTSVMLYNVNYTPLYKRMTGRYILATGGPYRFIRHPIYMAYILFTASLLLASGVWILLVVGIGYFSLPRQVYEEEKALVQLFGDVYSRYISQTGRLLPRLRNNK